jgi:4-hydroxy-tetrahydrodipicolinate synthase
MTALATKGSTLLTLSGMIPPVLSPLTTDRRADRDGIGRLAEYLISGGADGLFVLGSCGEGPSLTSDAAREVVEQNVVAVNGRVPVLAGVGQVSTERTIEAALSARDAGADALVVMTPMYYNTEVDEPLVRHVEAVAAAVDLPIVLYNIPHLTHHPITPSAVRRLAGHEQVVALKESSGDWEIFEPLATAALQSGIAVFQGAESLIARSLAFGASGAVPGIANLVPKLASDLVAAGLSGDAVRAAELQDRLDAACVIYGAGFWLTSLKSAVAETGLIGSTASLALTPLDTESLATLRATLAAVDLDLALGQA